MTGMREGALARIREHYDSGAFIEVLARRVAVPSTSQDPEFAPHLRRYLEEEIAPAAEGMGFEVRVEPNPEEGGGPLLTAVRQEDEALPTVLVYGHGDTVLGHEGQWREGRDPWTLDRDGERLYGRGTVDNKGQHGIALAALEAVLAERGRLGFNAKLLVETSEETGSKGLRAFAEANRQRLAADVLIASDGPRVAPRQADRLSRLARRHQLCAGDRRARGRAPFGQLGRAALQPRNAARERRRQHGRCARAHPGRGAPAAADVQRRAHRDRRLRRGRRAGRAGDRPRLGRAGAHALGARLRLERARSAGPGPRAMPSGR